MSDQLSLSDVPAHILAHAHDPDTSRMAARRGSALKASGRHSCLRAHALHPAGLTDDEVSALTGIEIHETRRRCTDLRNAGLIEFLARVTRKNAQGNQCTVSAITPTGLEALS